MQELKKIIALIEKLNQPLDPPLPELPAHIKITFPQATQDKREVKKDEVQTKLEQQTRYAVYGHLLKLNKILLEAAGKIKPSAEDIAGVMRGLIKEIQPALSSEKLGAYAQYLTNESKSLEESAESLQVITKRNKESQRDKLAKLAFYCTSVSAAFASCTFEVANEEQSLYTEEEKLSNDAAANVKCQKIVEDMKRIEEVKRTEEIKKNENLKKSSFATIGALIGGTTGLALGGTLLLNAEYNFVDTPFTATDQYAIGALILAASLAIILKALWDAQHPPAAARQVVDKKSEEKTALLAEDTSKPHIISAASPSKLLLGVGVIGALAGGALIISAIVMNFQKNELSDTVDKANMSDIGLYVLGGVMMALAAKLIYDFFMDRRKAPITPNVEAMLSTDTDPSKSKSSDPPVVLSH